jgi:hypothetical protein
MVQLSKPVLFLIFNRPDTTQQVFNEIRKARPKQLFVAADGPRKDRPDDIDNCRKTREIVNQVDWDCKVSTLFRNENLGCKIAVSSAIDWFFSNVDEGIILEDDCLPSQSFFRFCEELLVRYKDDMRIMMISGYNKNQTWKCDINDYFFSYIGSIWGWASWRRAWKFYNVNIDETEYGNNLNYLEFLLGKELKDVRINHFEMLKKGLDTWDYQWSFARHFNSGLTCVSSKSLISNIGFDKHATHTKIGEDTVKKMEIVFPLRENKIVIGDLVYDKTIHSKNSFMTRISQSIIKFLIR